MRCVSPVSLKVGFFSLLLSILPCESGANVVKVGPIEITPPFQASGNVVHVGHDLAIKEGSTNRDVVVILGNLDVEGTISGKATVILGNVQLGPKATVMRNMVMIGGELDRHPNAQFAGFHGTKVALPAHFVEAMQTWVKQGILWGRLLPHTVAWAWWVFGVGLVFFMFVGVLVPRPVQACSDSLSGRPLICFFAGLLTLILTGPLVVILAASVVGSLAIPFVLCAGLAALVLGKAGVNACVGHRFTSHWTNATLSSTPINVAVGTVLIGLIYFVPVIGLMTWGLIAVLGLGAAVLSFVRSLRRELEPNDKNSFGPIPFLAKPDAAEFPEVETGFVTLPRAGFWVRLGATLLDLLLIGAMLKLIVGINPQQYFLLVWVFYHFLMWGWLGTTIGGMIVGLRLFRQNGDTVNFAVAFVRCLAAFFSATVLFLGFFWAGWNREKLAWHDIIAGTVVARCPRGTLER